VDSPHYPSADPASPEHESSVGSASPNDNESIDSWDAESRTHDVNAVDVIVMKPNAEDERQFAYTPSQDGAEAMDTDEHETWD
jgi:hypothetical protein